MQTLFRAGAVLVAVLAFACPVMAEGCCGSKDKEVVATTPDECFKATFGAMLKGDKDAVWAQLSAKSQEVVAKKGEEMKEGVSQCKDTQAKLNVTADQVKEMSGRDLFLSIMIADVKAMVAKSEECGKGECTEAEKAECAEKGEECALQDVKIDGDKATAKCPKGMPLAFVKEKDAWKLDLATMMENGCCEEKAGGCESKEPAKE